MREYLPLLIIGGIVGALSAVFLVAYATMKDKKEAIGFDRSMKDGEIARRLLAYARPYVMNFVLVLCVMPTARMRLKERRFLCGMIDVFTAFMVIGRLVSGVHWVTDIIGGALLSASLVTLYTFFCGLKQADQK